MPPLTSPVGRVVAQAPRWVPQGRWWQWAVPGRHEALDMVAEDWALLQHRIRDCLRWNSLLQLEAWRPHTFGG